MTGRHAITREAALRAIDTPTGRGLIAAMAVGTDFGVAMPAASAAEQTSDNKAMGVLSVPETDVTKVVSTTAVTAPADAEWNIEQVAVEDESPVEVSASVAIPEPDPEPVVATPAAEESETRTATATETTSDASYTESESAATESYAAPAEEAAAAPTYSGSGSGQAVLNTALSYVGAPYVWGGTTPSGWDCIGFVRYVYAQHGVSIGGYTTSVLSVGRQVPYSQAQPGDILYEPGHVSIYAGNGQEVGAWNPSMGTRVGPNSSPSQVTVIRVFG